MRLARWIWLVLPAGIMLLFQRALVGGIGLIAKASGGLDPKLLFSISFLSIIPPAILFLIWYARVTRGREPHLVFASRGHRARDVTLGIGGAALCIAVFLGSLQFLRALSMPTPNFVGIHWVHHVFFSTVGAAVPGIAEEVYFRGFLQQKFRDLPPALVIFFTSVSFAFWHILTPPYLLHTFLIGVILGILYHRTRRLLPVVIAHTLANASVGILVVTGIL